MKKDSIRKERKSKEESYKKGKKALQSGNTSGRALVNCHGLIGRSIIGVAICDLRLGESEVWSKFAEGAHHFISQVDSVEKFTEELPDSHRWNRPLRIYYAFRAATIAQDQETIDRAIERTYSTDHELISERAPTKRHSLYHTFALASYLDDNHSAAQEWLTKLEALDHGYQKYDGFDRALRALLETDGVGFTTAIELILEAHHEEYGPAPDTAVGYLSLDAFCYLKLGSAADLRFDRDSLPSELEVYLPAPSQI